MNKTVQGNLRSKTAWFGTVVAALGAAQQTGVLDLIPQGKQGLVLSLVGFATVFLRNITTQPVEDKAPNL